MGTATKGEKFEIRVFELIKQELDAERLGLAPRACKIYRRKKYYSRDRDSDIEADISIEVFLPGQLDWSLLWVLECKDYSSPLSVDQVEEFHAKVRQIAGDNVKATLIISGALQKSALKFARSKGIGVMRITPDRRGEWILPRAAIIPFVGLPFTLLQMIRLIRSHAEKELTMKECLDALTDPGLASANRGFYACDGEQAYSSLSSLIRKVLREES
jgi:hypothetical protein